MIWKEQIESNPICLFFFQSRNKLPRVWLDKTTPSTIESPGTNISGISELGPKIAFETKKVAAALWCKIKEISRRRMVDELN